MVESILITLSRHELKELLREVVNESKEDSQKGTGDSGELLNVEQAATFLGLAKPTLYAHTSKREIPHLKRGKKLYFEKEKLIEWLQEGKQKTQAELSAEAQNYIKNRKGGKNGK